MDCTCDHFIAFESAQSKAQLANKSYNGIAVREDLLWRGILPIIPP
jgi:hypothetical protein